MKSVKKLLIVLAVLMMTMLLAACGDKVEDAVEDAVDNEAVITDKNVVGDWADERSQRAAMTIKKNEDGTFAVQIDWSNSASEADIWTMTASIDEDELVYTNCRHERVSYNENGQEISRTVIEENTHGEFEYKNGKLEWDGQMENEEGLFARID